MVILSLPLSKTQVRAVNSGGSETGVVAVAFEADFNQGVLTFQPSTANPVFARNTDFSSGRLKCQHALEKHYPSGTTIPRFAKFTNKLLEFWGLLPV